MSAGEAGKGRPPGKPPAAASTVSDRRFRLRRNARRAPRPGGPADIPFSIKSNLIYSKESFDYDFPL